MATEPPRGARLGLGLWPLPRDAWAPIAAVALLYAGHLLYGALVSDVALFLGIGAATAVLVGLAQPRLREDLVRLKGLALPALLFTLVLLSALWTLTPWTPGGPHPIWRYSGVAPGASAIDKSATTLEILKLLGLGCFFVLGAMTGGRDERAQFAVRLTLAAGAVFGMWAFIAVATGAIYQTQGHRLEAHFLNPNTAGTVFAALFVLGIGEVLREWRARPDRNAYGTVMPSVGVALICLVCLLASASRGAAMAMLGGLAVLVLILLAAGRLKPSRALFATAAAIAVLAVVVSLTGETLLDRVFHSREDAVGRSAIWAAHWRMFLASPLFGYGLGSAETVNRTLISAANYPVLWNIRAILNVYLQWLEEAGLVGAIPMFLCIGAVIARSLKSALRRRRMVGQLAALFAADAVFLIHGATDFGLEVTSVAAFWAWLLGLQFSLAQGASRR